MTSTRLYSPWIWPGMIFFSGAASGLFFFLGFDSLLRVLLTLWFLLVCPGMAFIRLLRLDKPYHEWPLAIALSIALNGLVAGFLSYTGLWSVGAGLTIVILISFVGAFFQTRLPGSQPGESQAEKLQDLSKATAPVPQIRPSESLAVEPRVLPEETALLPESQVNEGQTEELQDLPEETALLPESQVSESQAEELQGLPEETALPLESQASEGPAVELRDLPEEIALLPESQVSESQAEETALHLHCPRCQAEERQSKAGFSRSGNQKYRCGRCKRIYTIQSAPITVTVR